MKKLYSLLILIFTIYFAVANPAITVLPTSGSWKNVSTWSLGRLPMNGDTVVVPIGKSVTIDDVENLTAQFLYLKIYGTLTFSNGKLWINSSSSVFVFAGGTIRSTGSPSETLKIGGVDKYIGTDGTISGPVFANQATGAAPLGFISGIVLPVKFVAFDVARQHNDVLVQWEIVEEMNSNYYEVQRSENGNEWNTIANISAVGNTINAHSYSYTDKQATARLLYYRIRQVDIDGKSSVTAVRVIKDENAKTEIKVNAASSNSVYVHFSEQVKGSVIIRLISANGQILSQKMFDQPIGEVMISAQNATKGIYVVTVADGQQLKYSKEILL